MWDVVVIGGGIAGLTTAYALRRQAAEEGRPRRVLLVERTPRPGGKIVSDTVGGFLVEGGPDSFIVQKPWALELVRELGLEDRITAAATEHRTTYVVKDGGLVALPEGLQLLVPREWEPFERSPLLSRSAKLRVAQEEQVPPRSASGDESVADFVRRRFGDEVLEVLAEPLLAHIHVADVERMSLEATYPRLARMEERYGSLTAGMRAMTSQAGPHRGGAVFLTLRGGLSDLVDGLTEHLERGPGAPVKVRLGRCVDRLEATAPGGYRIHLDDGTRLDTRTVALTVPAFAAAAIVESLDAGLARRLGAIRYASLATLSLGYRRRDLDRALDGYGFFVLRREKRTVLASTWTSSKWEDRTPDDEHVLIRCFVGGASDEEVLEHDDATLVRRVRDDLHGILGFSAAPVLERLHRWPRGYPQYEVGHLDRVRAVESALPPGIVIAGSPYHGVGLPDCIRSARQAARSLSARLRERAAEVDGGVLAC